jgi:hypothetical protein
MESGTLEAKAILRGDVVIMRMKGRHPIMGGCCNEYILYLVYAVLGFDSYLWHGEIEMDN